MTAASRIPKSTIDAPRNGFGRPPVRKSRRAGFPTGAGTGFRAPDASLSLPVTSSAVTYAYAPVTGSHSVATVRPSWVAVAGSNSDSADS